MSMKGKENYENPSTNDSGFFSGVIEDSQSSLINSSSIKDFTPEVLQKSERNLLENFSKCNSEMFFQQDEDGFTRLHIAVLHNDQRSIDALLSIVPEKSYLNLRNLFGFTPLQIAIMLQNHEITHKLINHGCDVNIRCAGKNSLHLAVENRDLQSAQIILSARTNTKELLINLEMWNLHGETCFLVACKNRDVEMMKLLANKGADINARCGRSGYTALHYAVEMKSFEVIDFLLEEESLDINVENFAGWTSYQLCLINDCEQLANRLVTSGAIPYYTEEENDEDEVENNDLISKIAEIAVN